MILNREIESEELVEQTLEELVESAVTNDVEPDRLAETLRDCASTVEAGGVESGA